MGKAGSSVVKQLLSLLQDLIVAPLSEVLRAAVAFLPNIAVAAVILLVGWGAAVLLRKIIAKLLKAVGFNVISEKIGLTRFLRHGGVTHQPSHLIGLVVYWVIIFSMLIALFGALKLAAASSFLIGVLSFIPSLIVSLVILGLGLFLGRFLGNLVEHSSRLADFPFHKLLAALTRYGVIVVALFGILDYLNLASTLLSGSFALVFIIVPSVAVVAILIGGRSLVTSMLAGRFLMRDLKAGDRVSFDSIEGEIVSIDFITTKIRCPRGVIIIPNGELSTKILTAIARKQSDTK